MDLKEVGLEGVDWIHLAQDWDPWWAVVNTAMNLLIWCQHEPTDFFVTEIKEFL
jgi:hypothetical protein